MEENGAGLNIKDCGAGTYATIDRCTPSSIQLSIFSCLCKRLRWRTWENGTEETLNWFWRKHNKDVEAVLTET